MAFEARLPPLQPKVSAKLTLLAAGNGSLFAGPSTGGGLLPWGRPEGNMRRPLDVEGQSAQQVRGRALYWAAEQLCWACMLANLLQLLLMGLGLGPVLRPKPLRSSVMGLYAGVCVCAGQADPPDV